jgi:hypothetical protein
MKSYSVSLAILFNGILVSRVNTAGAASLLPFETAQFCESTLDVLRAGYAYIFVFSTPSPLSNATCKVFPGDLKWPNDAAWALLNCTINGELIKTFPIVAPYYSTPRLKCR